MLSWSCKMNFEGKLKRDSSPVSSYSVAGSRADWPQTSKLCTSYDSEFDPRTFRYDWNNLLQSVETGKDVQIITPAAVGGAYSFATFKNLILTIYFLDRF
jgi:hypothetical protein